MKKERKKLYKNRENKMVSGVCAGLADYLNIDVTIIRVIWAITMLFGSISFWAYLICSFVIPNRPNDGNDYNNYNNVDYN